MQQRGGTTPSPPPFHPAVPTEPQEGIAGKGTPGRMAAWVYFGGALATVEAQAGGEGLKRGPCACPLPTACTRVSSKAPAPPCQQLSCQA